MVIVRCKKIIKIKIYNNPEQEYLMIREYLMHYQYRSYVLALVNAPVHPRLMAFSKQYSHTRASRVYSDTVPAPARARVWPRHPKHNTARLRRPRTRPISAPHPCTHYGKSALSPHCNEPHFHCVPRCFLGNNNLVGLHGRCPVAKRDFGMRPYAYRWCAG